MPSAHGKRPAGLASVREEIDRLDEQVVAALAQRELLVREAATYKTSEATVRAPDRVERVIAGVRASAVGHGADPAVAEAVYRAMIDAFIALEFDEARTFGPRAGSSAG